MKRMIDPQVQIVINNGLDERITALEDAPAPESGTKLYTHGFNLSNATGRLVVVSTDGESWSGKTMSSVLLNNAKPAIWIWRGGPAGTGLCLYDYAGAKVLMLKEGALVDSGVAGTDTAVNDVVAAL